MSHVTAAGTSRAGVSPPSKILGLVPESLRLSEDEARCRVRFSADEPFFRGHFPDYPIVPGMIMVDGLVALAQRWSGSAAPLGRLAEAKFRAEVRPGSEVEYR